MLNPLASEIKLLARHALVYGGGIILSRIVSLLLLPFYTHYLSPTDYGVKELIALTVDVIGILIATAIASAFFRFYFEYETEDDKKEVVGTAFIGLVSLWILFACLFLPLTPIISKKMLDTSALAYYLQIAFATLLFSTLNSLGYNYLRANQRSAKTVTLSIVSMVVTVGSTIYFVAVASLGVLGVLLGNLVGNAAMFLILVCPIIFQIKLKFSGQKMMQMVKYGIPLIPSQLGNFAVGISDRYFLKTYLSIADAGVYSVGYRFGTITSSFIASPFSQIWDPRRLEAYKKPNSEVIFGKIFTYFLFLMIFAGLIVATVTREILVMMTPKAYWNAYTIVPIIVLSITIFSLHNHFNLGIMIHKKTKYYSYVDTFNGFFILLLNFVLIRKFGIYGAAIATLVAHSFRSTMIYLLSRRHYKIYFEFRRILVLLASASIIYYISWWLNFNSILVSFITKFFLMLMFPLVIFMFGFFSKEEIAKIKSIYAWFFHQKTIEKIG